MNESLSHYLSRCWVCASGSELDEDAVKYNEVVPGKLISQLDQQGKLFRAESRAAGIKPISNFDTSVAAPYDLNGVRTDELFDVVVDRSRGDIKLSCQILAGILPVGKQLR